MLAWNSAWGDIGELGSHRGFVSDPVPLPNTLTLELGTVMSFVYGIDKKPRLAFVMHPNFEGKAHCLTLKKIDRIALVRVVYPHIKAGMDDPQAFYYSVYKPALYDTDAYRTYLVSKISAVTMFRYSVPRPGSDAEMMENYIEEGKRSDAEFMREYDREIEEKSNK
jgi:hypothetical protein